MWPPTRGIDYALNVSANSSDGSSSVGRPVDRSINRLIAVAHAAQKISPAARIATLKRGRAGKWLALALESSRLKARAMTGGRRGRDRDWSILPDAAKTSEPAGRTITQRRITNIYFDGRWAPTGSSGDRPRRERRASIANGGRVGEEGVGGGPTRGIHYAKPAIRGWNMFRVPQSVTGRVGRHLSAGVLRLLRPPGQTAARHLQGVALRGCTRFPVICNSNDR